MGFQVYISSDKNRIKQRHLRTAQDCPATPAETQRKTCPVSSTQFSTSDISKRTSWQAWCLLGTSPVVKIQLGSIMLYICVAANRNVSQAEGRMDSIYIQQTPEANTRSSVKKKHWKEVGSYKWIMIIWSTYHKILDNLERHQLKVFLWPSKYPDKLCG